MFLVFLFFLAFLKQAGKIAEKSTL